MSGIFDAQTALQSRLDHADPFKLEYLQTLNDQELANRLMKRQEDLFKPLVRSSYNMREDISDEIKLIEDLISLRSFGKIRKKIDSGDESEGVTLV
ncbi:hypothetical protein [Alishewanella phage vB_AspM_Slickus01]|nr:hypothetical protein [Alishewanella phage vB_AspM_Slickus01]